MPGTWCDGVISQVPGIIIHHLIIPAGYEVVLEKLVEKTYAYDDINGCACCKQSHEEYIEPHIHTDSGGGDKAKAEVGELENLALQAVHRYAEHPLDDGGQGHYKQRIKRVHRQAGQQLGPFRKIPSRAVPFYGCKYQDVHGHGQQYNGRRPYETAESQ